MFPRPARVRWSSSAALSGARRPAAARRGRREGGVERLGAETRAEVRLELARLEQQPGTEAPHVAVGDRRAVVERENSARGTGRRRAPPGSRSEARSCAGGRAARGPTRSGRAGTCRAGRRARRARPSSSAATAAARTAGQPDVVDLDALEPPPLERGSERAPHRLDLGQLGHGPTRSPRTGVAYRLSTSSRTAARRRRVASS